MMEMHQIVSEDEWLAARKALLSEERAFTHARDALVAKRQALPWVAVSRAPLAKLEAFKRRMGWHFPWVSSHGSDFNFDYGVSFGDADKARGKALYNYEEQDYVSDELPGISEFYRDEAGNVYHTYSAYARGVEMALGAYAMLEFTAKGRNEKTDMREWMRHHDRYEDGAGRESAGQSACCAHESKTQ